MFESTEQLDDFLTRPNPLVVSAVGACPGDFLVLGAGGKMGHHLCRMLRRSLDELARPDKVIAVSRFTSSKSRQWMESHGVETIAADLSTADELAGVSPTANVFYLAGVKFGTANDSSLLQRMNIEMPQMVAQHFASSRIVALSTGCVYSFVEPASGGSTERDELDPPGEYARSCLGRERAFIDGSQQHGTAAALIRLNYSIDLRYGVLVDIAQKVLAGDPVDLETGYVNVIWQGDAIAQIIRSLPLAASPPMVLNITGSEVLSVRRIAEQFAERFERDVRFVGREAETCWLSNNSKARELFGEPAVTVEQMIEWIADWLQCDGETLGKPTHFENRNGSYG